ncbi:MAG: 3'-5' exoribonuclease domain-containing protein, partial [Candidatus Dormibacteria bacterium]
YQRLLEKACFVKFQVEPQMRQMDRGTDNDALEWWAEKTQHARDMSFRPKTTDLSVVDGINKLREYCVGVDIIKPTFWQRGGMDQMIFENLCRQAGEKPLAPYWMWLDVRTCLMLTKETASRGYCEVPGFDRSLVVKHDPVHDCAYDVLMMLFGK